MTTEKFCLRWNEFESNISVAFRELREEKDFFDVTLACDDEQIKSHKMILSACSPFFRNILRRNPHQHPLIYLKGVKMNDLQSVLSFMYHGEVNIVQGDLNSFLGVAEDLKVKGLTQNSTGPSEENIKTNYSRQAPPMNTPGSITHLPPRIQQVPKRISTLPSQVASSSDTLTMKDSFQETVTPVKTEPTEVESNREYRDQFNDDLQETVHTIAHVDDDRYEYDEEHHAEYENHSYATASSNLVRYQHQPVHGNNGSTFQDPSELLQFVRKDAETRKYICTMCEKFSHQGKNMVRNHVESQHFPNTFSYTCDLCGDVLSSRSSHMLHRSKKHLNNKHV